MSFGAHEIYHLDLLQENQLRSCFPKLVLVNVWAWQVHWSLPTSAWWWTLLTDYFGPVTPINLVKTFSEPPYSLRLFQLNIHLLFHFTEVIPVNWFEGFPCPILIPLLSSEAFPPNKSLEHLIPSWHLLIQEPTLTHFIKLITSHSSMQKWCG